MAGFFENIGGALSSPIESLFGATEKKKTSSPMLGAMESDGSSFELGNVGNYFKPGTAGNQWGGLWDKMAGPSDEDLGALADAENEKGGAVAADLGTGSEALSKVGKKMDFNKMSQVLKSIQGNMDNEPRVSMASHRGGGFNYNAKQYENPLLTREYQGLYMEPLYKNLI